MPNRFGGREDLEAVDFLQELNAVVHATHPGVSMIAEESTAWPGVSRPTEGGGLGFTFKWNMGWMHDTLALRRAGAGASPLAPRRADVLDGLRLGRELRPPALARRGRAREGRAAPQDAGGRVAAVRQPARALRAHVGAPREAAALHGRRARPGHRVVGGRLARLVRARLPAPPGDAAVRRRPQRRLPGGAGALGGRLPAGGLRVARRRRAGGQHAGVPATLGGRRAPARLPRQLLARRAAPLAPSPAGRRRVARGAEHRRRGVRRLGRRQRRRRDGLRAEQDATEPVNATVTMNF